MRKSKSPLPLSLPSPKMSAGLPAKSGGRGKALHARSAEDIPKAVRAAGGKDVGGAGSKSRGSSPATISVPQAGIRYITEGLIKKIAKEENLEQITSLNLMLSKEGGKKIKYIENLEKLKRLQTLNLSCNVIEKIEKLDRLSKLRELNLSFNSISRLDGLESLVNLHSLNVTGNVIENIPPWFSKKLKALRVFRIAKNRLATLSECIKLKVLPDLVQFSTADNPVADLPHARLYLVFHLRSLESLDGVTVTEEDRQEAQTRFEQEEVEQLERQLEAGETRYRKLEHDHNKSVHELQQRELTEQEHKKRASLHQDKIQDLERELTTKNDLLRKKTVELTKACEKHYQLEQELAFYKIDSKFETLGHRPETTDLDDSGNLDESPYIGRARYKANQLAQEGSMVASPQQARLHQSDTAVTSNLSLHPDVRDEMNRTLDREIADKQKAIDRAKSELERMQTELGNTEQQVLAAAKELKRVRDLTPYTEHTEQHKQKLRQALAKKMRHVNELRDAAAQVEEDMGRVQADAQQTQTDLSDLRGRLQGMDTNHPHYRKTYREMVDKEQQISESSQLFAKLQQQLEAMLETIAKETSEIRQMEQKLNEDQISQNEDLREELGGIVGGLQTYLQSMKSQSKQQQQELQELLSQREALEDKLRMMENDLSVRDTETADYLEMKSRLAELEESLQEHRDQNEFLQEQLQSFHQDPEITDRIESAETEIKGLRKALRDAQKKAESDRVTMEKELDAERARAQEALQNLPAQSQQEGAIKRLTQQLEAVKALNESLQDEMEDQQQKLQQQLNETIPPEELRQRLGHLASIITKGRALIQPDGRDDFVGETFRHIQKVVQEKMNTSQKDAERLKQEKSHLDGEVQSLRQKMNTLQGQGSDAEAKVQRDKYLAKLEAARKKDADQIRKLEEELNKLGKALRDAHAKSKQAGMGTQTTGQTQMVYDLEQGTETEGDSLNTEERDLLDELQRELMELRNAMHNKEIEQAKQMADAEADATTRDNDFRRQQAMFQKEMERQRKELELERQRQDARARVLDGDLSQARNEADALQRMLEEKTHNLTAPGSNMTNEMIAAQEEEIAHLYDILERQRGEIDRLNRALHHVTDQGPEGYGPGYEEEMSRLRGEVTRLKETLAMQSQYVQSMSPQPDNRPRPPGVSMGTQSQFRPPVQPVPSLRQPIPQPPYQYQQSVNQVRPRSQQPHPLYPQPIIPTQSASQGHVPGHHGDYGGEDIPDGLTNQRIAGRTDQPMKEPRTPFEGSARSRIQNLPQHGTAGHQGHSHRLPEAGDAPLHSTPTNERDHPGNKDRADGSGSQFVDHLETRTPWGRYGGTTRGPTTFTDRRENKSRSPPRSRVRPDQPEVPGHDVEARAPYVPPAQPTRVYSAPYRPPGTNIRGWNAPLAPGGRGSHLQPTPEVSPIRPLAVHSRQIRPSDAQSGMPRAANPTSHSQVMPPPQTVMPHSSTQYVHVPPSGQPVPPSAYPMPPPHVPQQPVPHATHPVPHPQSRSLQGHSLPVHLAPHGAPAPSSGRVTPGSVPHGAMPGVIAPEGPGQPMYIPVTPVYTAPLNDGVTQTNAPATTNQPGTVFLPISPIRPTNGKMERAPTRGILKKSDEEEGDESYLYCNVPEHHELEDHIASLQEKIKELKLLLKKGKFHKGSVSDIEETRLIRRLIAELEERRVDLEGLDLAIERQKKDMRRMKREERSLVLDKSTADEELNVLKVKNKRMEKRNKYLAQFDSDSDDDFDYRAAKKQQKHLTNEIECLQKTLLKRRAELRDTERQLKQCSDNLRDARGQARDTVRQYDQASVGLQNTVRDAVEIEKRANDAGVELIKVSDQLATLKSEVRELDRKKSQQDRLLKEINQIIAKKDKEFREMETRSKQATINCQRITTELAASEHREKEVTATLRESEDVLGSRRTELNRLREQIENQRSELEKVDQQMGRRKTELRMLEETLGRKQSELNAVLRDAETEVSSKQRELKEHWEQAKTLESQNTDLTSSVKVKRAELHQLRSDIDEENEALEKILGAVSKQKSELKHTFEMQKLEQTELESLKSQHNQKLAELEKTQAALLDERAELERLTTETNRKTGELERLRQSLDRERAELDRVAMEKRGLEERITTLSRDKELLEENSKSVDNRLNQMKRAVAGLEDRLEAGTRRVEQLDEESQHRETEVEQLNAQRALLQKDVTSLKNIIDNGRGELKDLKDQVSDAQDHAHNLEQDLRDTQNQRDSLLREIEELESAVRESRMSHELCVEHESEKKKELQEVLQNLEIHRAEFEEVLRLVSSTNSELSHIQSAVAGKEEELTLIINNINKLKNEAETRVMTGEKFTEMEKEIRELRRDLVERNREKNELSYALTRSYEEVQKLRSESAQEREKLIADQLHLERLVKELKHQLDHTQQELVDQQRKTESQVVELESLAQEHIRRANQLNRDIGGKGGHDDPKKQGRHLPQENKENAVRDVTDGPVLDEWKREALKDKLIQEQDYLRQQLRQQMSRHSEAMESVRLQSEGTLDSLRRKLNNLQDVLVSSGQPSEVTRSRSPAGHDMQRAYSKSPKRNGVTSTRSYSSQRPRSRSRSPEKLGLRSRSDRLGSPIFPERDVPAS